jgi:hypothetical protein
MPKTRYFFYAGAIVFSVLMFGNLLAYYPTSQDIGVTRQAITFNHDLNTNFDNAWLVYYLGGKPNTLGCNVRDNNVFLLHGLVLSNQMRPDCQTLINSKSLNLLRCL